jgi:hypothetical protein
MSKPPASNRNSSVSPTSARPFVSVAHQPDKPSSVVRAAYTSSTDADFIPTLWSMSTIAIPRLVYCLVFWNGLLFLAALNRFSDPPDAPQAGVPG